ncbi:MAG: adenylosuccinate synthetase [Candidatus Dasytiphilus stammeri]
MDLQNFQLEYFSKEKTIDQKLLDKTLLFAESLPKFTTILDLLLYDAYKKRKIILLEGSQGRWLDIDHGTYPYVTSSNTLLSIVPIE